MKKLLLPSVLALAACAPGADVHAPVETFEYGAISHDPFWIVSIGGDRIVLTMGPEGGRADGELVTHEFPRALPVEEADGTRRWQSGSGTAVIAVEAKPGPCKTGGRTYADATRVTLSGREMFGCGGRELREGA